MWWREARVSAATSARARERSPHPLGGRAGLATFAIAHGLTRTVSVKLSKSQLKALRKAKRINATATAVAHDANVSRKTSSGKLTLLAPR